MKTTVWQCKNKKCELVVNGGSNKVFGDGKTPICCICGKKMTRVTTSRDDARLAKMVVTNKE